MAGDSTKSQRPRGGDWVSRDFVQKLIPGWTILVEGRAGVHLHSTALVPVIVDAIGFYTCLTTASLSEGNMKMDRYSIVVDAQNERDADVQARSLADSSREISGVESAERKKATDNTMDLGTIVSIVATSGATLALAQGIADWLRSRRSTKLIIERDVSTDSIKATVEKIDPETAKQIIELVLNAQ